MDLNVSNVSENALVDAIRKPTELKRETGLDSPPPVNLEGRGRDLNPDARLHRPGCLLDIGRSNECPSNS